MNQRGQAFIGFFLIIIAMAALMSTAWNNYRRVRKTSQQSYYKELALDLARSGFVDTHAYFRRQAAGVGKGSSFSYTLTSTAQGWADDLFRPSSKDTEYWTMLSTTAWDGTPAAEAIVKTVPLTLTGTAELKDVRLWGRWVIKRQNVRNWCPGANTCSANTDPDACHDLTGKRGPGGTEGGGSNWGITARSYVYAFPGDLSDTALLEGGKIWGAPLPAVPADHPNPALRGRRLLLASAKVYGEIVGLLVAPADLKVPLQVSNGNRITINGAKAIVDGGAAKAYARTDSTVPTLSNSGVLLPASSNSMAWAGPAIGNVIPGYGMNDLAALADYVGGVNATFPDHNGLVAGSPEYEEYKQRVSTKTFYFINGNAVFSAPAENRRMLGVGLVVVNGNLTIQDGNASDWAGIVYVNGNVDMRSGSISGVLIATGTVNIQGGTLLNTRLSSNYDVAYGVQNWMFHYRVNKASVISD